MRDGRTGMRRRFRKEGHAAGFDLLSVWCPRWSCCRIHWKYGRGPEEKGGHWRDAALSVLVRRWRWEQGRVAPSGAEGPQGLLIGGSHQRSEQLPRATQLSPLVLLLPFLLSFFFLFFLKKIIYEYPIHKKIKWSCCSGQSDIWRPGAPAVETLSSQPGLLQHPSKKPPELLRAPLKMQESIDATRLQRHSVYLEK